ncbi:MAG: T9SS type A sorting domain-containing protein [Rhodothermales bacterium]|nr:T9SS type A sorting domain-containing protein [Rhodothermales bacterium]
MRFATLLLLFVTLPATAQPVFDADDWPFEPGTVFTVTERNVSDASGANAMLIQALAEASGANQTWDFTAITYDEENVGTYEVFGAPFPSDFPEQDTPPFDQANLGIFSELDTKVDGQMITVDFWFYSGLTSAQAVSYGAVFDGEDFDEDGEPDQGLFTFDPLNIDVIFPLAFEDSWTENYTQTIMLEGVGSFSQAIAEVTEVDGWGTCIFSEGSFPCLRLAVESEIGGFPSTTYEFLTFDVANAAISEFCAAGFCFYDASASVFEPQGTAAEGSPDADALTVRNHPNPFAGTTRLTYHVPQQAHVRLAVYDVLGREVAVLVDEVRPEGEGTAVFRAMDLPGGVYFYRLEADERTRAGRMLLLD